MNQILRSLILSTFVCLLAQTAAAHPGHGHPGPLHYLTQPVHWLPIVVFAALVGLFFASQHLIRSRRRAWNSRADDLS